MANSLDGKQHTDFSLPIQHNDLANFVQVLGRKLVKLNSNYLPNAVCWQLFNWFTKVGKIDPRGVESRLSFRTGCLLDLD